MFNKIIKKLGLKKRSSRPCGCDNEHWCQDCLANRVSGELFFGKSGDGSDIQRVKKEWEE